MPHDKNGTLLQPGDKVTLEMTVQQVYPDADTCNVTLVRHIDGEQQLSLTCQAKQVEKMSVSETDTPAETVASA